MGKLFLVITTDETEAAHLRRLLAPHAKVAWTATLVAAHVSIAARAPDLIIPTAPLASRVTLRPPAPW